MRSSVKVVSPSGISTKFAPIKKNGLDYIDVDIVVRKIDQIKPTANSAKKLSAELIHQKCGHFHHDRIIELAKRKLVEGLPVNLPQLLHECRICLVTKSRNHPRRSMQDYTLLQPG